MISICFGSVSRFVGIAWVSGFRFTGSLVPFCEVAKLRFPLHGLSFRSYARYYALRFGPVSTRSMQSKLQSKLEQTREFGNMATI